MQTCPHCHQTTRQNRAGETQSGSQRYKCMHCGHKYTPEPKQHGYPDEVRKQALQLYVDGMNLRRIGRHLGIHHRTVSLWVKASAANLSKRQYLKTSRPPKWMSYSPLSARKKQDLHHHDRRPPNTLLLELQSGLGAHTTRYSGDGRRSTKGQTVFQRCF